MLRVVDELKLEYPQVEITSKDANGKHCNNTRWLYLKSKPRRGNVFMEIWYHPTVSRIDFVMYRKMMAPSENKESMLDGNKRPNDVRGCLKISGLTADELKEFVRNKIECYLNRL